MEQINPELFIASLGEITAELPDRYLKDYGRQLYRIFMHTMMTVLRNPGHGKINIASITKDNDYEILGPVIEKLVSYGAQLGERISGRAYADDAVQAMGFYSKCYFLGAPYPFLGSELEKKLNEHPVHSNPGTKGLYRYN